MAAAIDNDTAEFDLQRQRAQQQIGAQKQGQQDALKRRFAAMGNINSGAYVKANENVDIAAGNQLNQANEGINAAQTGELRRRRELASGQDFASGESQKNRDFGKSESAIGRAFSTQERIGSQDFSGQQADAQRGFITGERLGSQDFSGQQANLQRGFITGERLGSQDFASQQQTSAQSFANDQRAQGQSFQESLFQQRNKQDAEQFGKQHDLDKSTTEFNKSMAKGEANKPERGILGGILGDTAVAPGSPMGIILDGELGAGASILGGGGGGNGGFSF